MGRPAVSNKAPAATQAATVGVDLAALRKAISQLAEHDREQDSRLARAEAALDDHDTRIEALEGGR